MELQQALRMVRHKKLEESIIHVVEKAKEASLQINKCVQNASVAKKLDILKKTADKRTYMTLMLL